MSERIEDFIVEAREHLATVEDSLLALEKLPASDDAPAQFDRCLRSMHSIKGDAGFLGLAQINQLAHAMESLLSETSQPIAAKVVETLFAARDRLAVLVDSANRHHSVEIDDLLARLSTGPAAKTFVELDVDLAAWNLEHPGGLARIVRQLGTAGSIRNPRILLNHCNLRDALPTGTMRWMGMVESTGDLNSFLGFPPQLNPSRSEAIVVDLSDKSRHSNGIRNFFSELKHAGRRITGRVLVPSTDLSAALPGQPVKWIGEIDTTLTRAQLRQKLGCDFDEPQALASATEQSTDSPALASPSMPVKDESIAIEATRSTGAAAKSTAGLPGVDSDKSTTLRIQVELLDRLMTLVGELTLVRNQSLLAFADEDGPQRAIIQRLNSVTSELQDATLRARMQPVGNLFNKFPRMVRDLARQLGKQVELDLEGREVELDKTILEQLSDPLMHLIRNSVDHGIELPHEREAKGKPPAGRIVLSATHEDGQVHIQIRDDGKGIDAVAVKAKALSLRLRTETELDRMSPRELFSLILLPGFSTARQVTEVSGRGVGMDVVKTNIEQLEGTLNIDSVVGLGCSMVLRLPLTLAIIPCLIVTAQDERFAVPQRELEEVVCLHRRSPCRIEQAFDTEVYRLRENLLPIVRLSDVLERKDPFTVEAKTEILAAHAANDDPSRIQYILVLRLAGRRFGLVVDEVRGTQEIVVKPMHTSMKRVGIFTGATIMGDGRVALITDAEGIVEHARLSFESALQATAKTSASRDAAQAHRVLLFEYGPQEQFALPLLQIRRIEMVTPNRIERVGEQEYVTVDGVSTRILRLNKVLNASSPENDTTLMSLILPKFVPQPMGILVSRIVDTESLALDLQEHPDQDPGILGTAIVRGRLTLFLEMHRLSEKLFGLTRQLPSASDKQLQRAKRLLLIDDTAFFREVIKRYLVAEGHDITTAVNGEDGLARLSLEPEFDLIVSDIEMPIMDGWDFAREARRRGITTPLLALTSLSGVQYESKAKECGFDSYEVKLDHDRLVRKVRTILAAHEATTGKEL